MLLGVLATGAGGRDAAQVTLQVAPRGPGSVASSPLSVNDTTPCTGQSNENDCAWRYEAGTTVRLTATPDPGAGRSFAGWSDPRCGAGATCTLKLDDPLTTLVATFSPLMLGVAFSEDDASRATATFDPAGQPCARPPGGAHFCREYPAHTSVRVTAVPGSKPFTEWNANPNGAECLPRNQPACTISVDDQPTWAGARFGNEPPPQLATTIKVEFRLGRTGDGSGRLTATGLDCGASCATTLGFGKQVTVTATPDPGSRFDGWNGVCPTTGATCTLAVGPITRLEGAFARDVALTASLTRLAVKRTGARRVVVAGVRTSRSATVRLALACRGRRAASGVFAALAGANTFRLAVPRSVAAGRCRLAVTVGNAGGGTLALPGRGLTLPRAR